MIRILSLGAGVQSSTLLLMAVRGEFELPDHAIFADTGWEPRAVYEWLEWLTAEVAGVVPIHRVTAGDLRSDVLAKNTRYASPPFHLLNLKGKKGMTRRQCTKGYKIEPIEKKVRELMGVPPRHKVRTGPCRTCDHHQGAHFLRKETVTIVTAGRKRRAKLKRWFCVSTACRCTRYNPEPLVEHWFGISLDEISRMRDADRYWKVNRYPLVDQRMTRAACLKWMADHGYPKPPRSACIGCPFHNNAEWRNIRTNAEEWADAVDFDRQIRVVGLKALRGIPFVHPSLRPLDEVDLSTPEERGQTNMFVNDCAAECGL